MFGKQLRTRYTRTVMIGLLGVLVGACVFGLPALASTTHPNAHSRQANSARHTPANALGKSRSASANTANANTDLHAAANAALAGLVTNGTITQHQADVIGSQIDSGTVDFEQLVSSGVVSQSQMGAVATALAQVKTSFAASTGGAADKTASPNAGGNTKSPSAGDNTKSPSAGDNTKSPSARGNTKSPDASTQSGDARVEAAAKAALDGLVSNGTITQHQEDVIEAQVIAGNVDPEQLVSSGVVSASQMNAVNNALVQVKQSFANG